MKEILKYLWEVRPLRAKLQHNQHYCDHVGVPCEDVTSYNDTIECTTGHRPPLASFYPG